MILGDAVNVFLGLALTFGVIAGLTSALMEAIASGLKLRASTLLSGMKELLNDPALTGLAGAILTHAAINPRAPAIAVGAAAAAATAAATDLSVMPSYISPGQFALTLLDVLQHPGGGPSLSLGDAIETVSDPQLKNWLQGMFRRTGGDIVAMQTEIAAWFNASMDRVSGIYKRRAQLISFCIALALAALLNVDAFHMVTALWGHSAVVAQALGTINAGTAPSDAVTALAKDFPMGWPVTSVGALAWATRITGWLATAIATLFGAPFWFDSIQRVAQIRGTGPAPR